MILATQINSLQFNLSISLFFLLVIIVLAFLVSYSIQIKKIIKIYKFKTQEVEMYKNKKYLNFNYYCFGLLNLIFFLIALVSFLLIVTSTSKEIVWFYLLEGVGLIQMIFIVIFLTSWTKKMQTAIMVYKNNKLLVLDILIEKDKIISIKSNSKQTQIYLDYWEGMIQEQIVIKNSQKVLDFLSIIK